MDLDGLTDNSMIGAWKLDHFEELNQGNVYQYLDILILSKRYYSDYQVDRSVGGSIHCHVGVYKLIDDHVTFHIQISNRQDSIGRVETGIFTLEDDILRITFLHGEQPGTWVYKRLDE
jgi:hypothetical protein